MTGYPLTMTLIFGRRVTTGSYRFICYDMSGLHGTSEYLRIQTSTDVWQELCPLHAPKDIWSTADMYYTEQLGDGSRETYNSSWYSVWSGTCADKVKI